MSEHACQRYFRLAKRGGSSRAAAFIVLALLLIAGNANQTTVFAQAAGPALVMNIRGDLWAWAGPGAKVQQRTNWGYNKNPVLSPDGKRVAYKSTAQVAVDAIRRSGGIGGGDLPANIWILDVATNNAIRVADQPAGASLLAPNVPDKYVVRSDPTWSPDGKSVAWTELVQDSAVSQEGVNQLVVYSLEQKSTKVIVSKLPKQYGVPAALQVLWGKPGIAVRSTASATDAKGIAAGEDSILIYDPAGTLLSSAKIGLLSEFAWITERGRDYVAVLTNGAVDAPTDPQWVLIEPATGRIIGMPGVPEVYSPAAPDGLSLFPTTTGASPEWQIAEPGRPVARLGTVDDVYVFSSVLAFSPDGKQIAYVKQGAAYVYSAGQIVKIVPSDVGALAWGPVAWRVRHTSGP